MNVSGGVMLTETCKGCSDGGDSEHVELQEGEQLSENVSGDENARGSKNGEGYGGETGACFGMCFSSV